MKIMNKSFLNLIKSSCILPTNSCFFNTITKLPLASLKFDYFCSLSMNKKKINLDLNLISNLSKSTNNLKPLYNLISCAQYRSVNYTKHARGITRRGGGWDENLTVENREYLKEVLVDTYANQESPLKDGPWIKGTWNEESM